MRSKPCCEPLTIRISSGARLHAEAQQVAGQVAPQRRVAADRGVLQERVALLAHDLVEHAAEGVGREQRAVRHAARERDQRVAGVPVPRAEGAPPLLVGRDDLRALRESSAAQSMRRRPGTARPAARAARVAGHERPLPDVGAGQPGRHQLLVGQRHRGPVDAAGSGASSRVAGSFTPGASSPSAMRRSRWPWICRASGTGRSRSSGMFTTAPLASHSDAKLSQSRANWPGPGLGQLAGCRDRRPYNRLGPGAAGRDGR